MGKLSRKYDSLLGSDKPPANSEGPSLVRARDPESGHLTVAIASPGQQHPKEQSAQPVSTRSALRTFHSPLKQTENSLLANQVAKDNEIKDLKSKLHNGDTVVELGTDKIDSSPVSDRMEGAEEETAALMELIRDQGQLVPILVRPHPNHPDRYQVAFGHRRLKVVTELGRTVKAIVRPMTDDELLLAQGQENSARLDLTYVERARFACTLHSMGYDNKYLMQALNVNKSQVSWYLRVGKIPAAIINAIGRAPAIGRPRWLQLAELIAESPKEQKAIQIVQTTDFVKRNSDERFFYLMDELTKKDAPKPQESLPWSLPDGRKIASFTYSDTKCTVQIDRRIDPTFAEFLYSKFADLYRDHEAQKAQSPSPTQP